MPDRDAAVSYLADATGVSLLTPVPGQRRHGQPPGSGSRAHDTPT